MKIGDIVVVPLQALSNGATEAPAIVNRVWGPLMANVMVFPDCGQPFGMTSVALCESKAAALAIGPHTCWIPE